MTQLHWLAAAGLSFALAGCQTTASQNSTDSHNIALLNGQIYTVNPQQPWAQAMVIEDGKIVFVGSTEDAQPFIQADMQTLDLNGKLALPGLHDVHTHPLEAGSERITCILDTEQNLNQALSIIRTCAAQASDDEWLLGWGHDLSIVLDTATSPRAMLDAIESTRPVAIMEATSHSIWVNSKALELVNISGQTPNPPGGIILLDAQGEANGILLDAAGDLVFDLAYAPTPERLEENYQGLLYGLEQAAMNGITSLVDARVYWKRGYLSAWQRAEQENTLTARTVLSLWAYPNMNDDEQLQTLTSLFHSDTNSLLNINQIKFYSDGILHNTTAALLAPYQEYFPEVGSTGLNYFDKNRLARYTTELEKVGFNMHIHAIGDRGVRESLDAIESARKVNGELGARHRLTHVEMVDEQDKPRFAQLNAIADFQLAGDFTKPEFHQDTAYLIGERSEHMLPVRDIYNTGATVTLSSDWDVSDLSPFVGMQNALTRGAQSMPNLASVIKAYTINGAYTMGQEQQTGSLTVGKFADVVIVDQNLFEVPVTDIAKTKVLMTILGGETVYDAGKL